MLFKKKKDVEHVAYDYAMLKKLNAGVSTVLIPAIYSYQNYSHLVSPHFSKQTSGNFPFHIIFCYSK